VLAISGFNITLILSLMSSSLFFIPKRYRLLPSGVAVVLFTIFVGMSASAERACIMGCLGLLAMQSGRLTQTRLTVLWTMAFMLLWKPQSLWDDAGFQLSFLAVISLSEYGELLTRWTKHIPEVGNLREQLHLTLTAQLLTAPWIAWIFGRVSLISPLANILVAPAIPLSMLFGTLTLMSHLLGLSFLETLLQPICSLLLRWMVGIPHLLSTIPFSGIDVPNIGGLVVFFLMFLHLFPPLSPRVDVNHGTLSGGETSKSGR
jgi:competence protein ComEC